MILVQVLFIFGNFYAVLNIDKVNYFKGCLKTGQSLVNTRTGKSVKMNRLVKLHASELSDVTEVYAGDIFATWGVDCASGDTFAGKSLGHLFFNPYSQTIDIWSTYPQT